MAESHADELTLLAYVDAELPPGERRALEEHLEGCLACAEGARRLQAGRGALREAPLLGLSEERRRALFASLPERRERPRFFAPLRRLGPALPAAAALVFVAAVVAFATQLPGGGEDESADEAGGGAALEQPAQDRATAETAQGEESQELGDSPTAATGELVARVQGPVGEVVRLLRRSGRVAFVRDGSVVAMGEADEIRAELENRPSGPVRVYVR